MTYLMIDCKSFFASVEAVERGMDPLTAQIVIMRDDAAVGSGLVVSASPAAKQRFKIGNVDRGYQVPNSLRLLQVPPRHWLYEEYSSKINQVYQQEFGNENVFPYSIDESLITIDCSIDEADRIAKKIQILIFEKYGIYTTVGIGQTPVQAKLALDLISKHAKHFRGVMTDDDFKEVLWPIKNLTNVWSIGPHTAQKLHRMGVHSIKDLAYYDLVALKAVFKSRALQLHALAWAQDAGNHWAKKTPIAHQSVSASKIFEIDVINKQSLLKRLEKITDSLYQRLGQRDGKTITLFVRYSNGDLLTRSKTYNYYLKEHLFNTASALLLEHWDEKQPVRQLGVGLSKLAINNRIEAISLF